MLSLPFNPYHVESNQQQKLYEAVIADFAESREVAIKQTTE